MIERKSYLEKLIKKQGNGLVKVISGIRRCGKSYLLFNMYRAYLESSGVDKEHIIAIALDNDINIKFRNPIELGKYIRSLLTDKKPYYVFLDEIQKVKSMKNPYIEDENETVGFVDVLLGLMQEGNVDIYVTGSNSRMLSTDIITEFRGRSDEVRVYPLSFSEFYDAYSGDKREAWKEYFTYGGMPYLMSLKENSDKSSYLHDLFDQIYLMDIIERHKIQSKTIVDDILDIVASSVGSLTNPDKIADTFRSVKKKSLSDNTIAKYLDYLEDAFMIRQAKRYDVKGRKYIGSPFKYYYTDIGLRNSRLNFRQTEENHIMENIIYNELIIRGFSVDIGIVAYNYKKDGKSMKSNLEIDFVANDGGKRYYIQSALTVSEEEKRLQEVRPYGLVSDSFKKIVVLKDCAIPWYDENGVFYVGIEKFLLDKSIMQMS